MNMRPAGDAPMAPTEHDWLAAYRGGDVEALARLVDHFRRPLFGFILRMTEGRDDADEVFQEVWFRAIKHLPGYRDQRFLSWLFRIAHNLIIDRARKARPVTELPRDREGGGDPFEDRVADRRIGPAREAAGKDLGRRISRAVARLPDEQRAVFTMRTEGDLPFKDIARIQGVSINTALARMHYALAKLKQELAEDYEALIKD
jgi:RNA polymerase sigma-70 factor (ECF subfamily)